MRGKLRDLTVNRDGTQNITVTVDADFTKSFDSLKDKPVTVEIKKESKERTRDANAFCWALCTDIGKALTPPVDKEEIYRRAIKAAGVYWQTEIPCFHLQSVCGRWEERGKGWFVEVMDDAAPGRKLVHMYFGTSTYTVDEMKTILDWLIDQAEQMEIPIPLSKKEEKELIERWGKK